MKVSLQVSWCLNPYYPWQQILAMFQPVSLHDFQTSHNGSQQNRCHHKLPYQVFVLHQAWSLPDCLLHFQQDQIECPLSCLLQPEFWHKCQGFPSKTSTGHQVCQSSGIVFPSHCASLAFTFVLCGFLDTHPFHYACYILCSIFPASWLYSLTTNALSSPSVQFMSEPPQVLLPFKLFVVGYLVK